MATMTVARLHKLLGQMVAEGDGRRPVCVNKASFSHPLESDGVAILDVTEATAARITIADDDGFAATNKDGSERLRRVLVLSGVHGQTLKRLAERGGLCPEEIMWNLKRLKWGHKVTRDEAIALTNGIASNACGEPGLTEPGKD